MIKTKNNLLVGLAFLALSFSYETYATTQLCENLFLNKRLTNSKLVQIVEIPNSQQVFTNTPEIKGAITFSTSSLLNKQTEINLSPDLKLHLAMALLPSGALGLGGVLGPLSSINQWGPVGDKIINPSTQISGYDWSSYAKYFNTHGGALDKTGVISPISAVSKFGNSLGSLIPGNQILLEGAPLMMLGRMGPLGPRSSIGALGTIGAHGNKRDEDGDYVHQINGAKNKTQISYDVLAQEDKGLVSEKLYEFYDSNRALELSRKKQLKDRFAVAVKLKTGRNLDLNYSAKAGEWITFTVSPSGTGDFFSLEILDSAGNMISQSRVNHLVNLSVWYFAHDAEIVIRVKNEGRSIYYNPAIEALNLFYKTSSSMNPFFDIAKILPPNPFTQTSEARLLVDTNEPVTESQPTPGPHWTQFR